MNGIIINIDPVILQVGHFELRWYGLAIMLAVAVAVLITAHRSKQKGIAREEIYSLALWVVLGGLLGARLFHVIDQWEYYAGNPLQIFAVWQGGLAIWGALAGGFVAAVIFARLKQMPFGRLADTLVPGLLVAQIIGRFACIIDGDAVGAATNLPWAFTYINPNAMVPPDLLGVPVHPYPVYDQLWNLLGLAIALKLRRRLKTDGLLFLSYLSIYAVGRFILTFVRQEKVWFWGLQEAQVVAIGILIISVSVIMYLTKKAKPNLTAPVST